MTRSALPRSVAVLVGLLCLPLTLAGCTTSGKGSAATTPSQSVTANSPVIGTATSTVPPTGAATTTGGPGTTSSSGSPSTPAFLKDSCTFAQLAVRAIQGGAAPGQEIELITFTNVSVTSCTLYGFPGVSLRLGGALLGQPAVRMTGTLPTPKLVRLSPGEQAQAMLTDFSSCQAPLSDTVRVYPPNSTQFSDRPAQMRGCHLEIAAVSHS